MDSSNGQDQLHRKKPTLQQLVDLSQIVGALGVIISLLVLAGEVRQNTRALRAGTFQDMTAMGVELRGVVAADSAFTHLYQRALATPDSLSQVERTRWSAFMGSTFRQFENLHYQYQNGLLAPEMWAGYDYTIRGFASTPGYSRWYRAHTRQFSEPFQAYMAEVLRSTHPLEPTFAPAQ